MRFLSVCGGCKIVDWRCSFLISVKAISWQPEHAPTDFVLPRDAGTGLAGVRPDATAYERHHKVSCLIGQLEHIAAAYRVGGHRFLDASCQIPSGRSM